ncbi:MAG: hypothetical protein CFK49_03505 [Armatimonadetes bacterium JP3_11]|nr:MAG: hypothetical protein CFK48_00495 [Armatimonadetes bacterium CP1_7O]OYT75367.1 MAG: hypothetical protein CFK49_03505 [Armatimonadetes bacterium JP3_11]
MKRAQMGCLAGVGVAVLGAAVLMIWAYRPPQLEVPKRVYPPNNAYDKLVAIAQRLRQVEQSTPRLRALKNRASETRLPAPMSPADHAEYARAVTPILREYRRHLDAPSKAVTLYDSLRDPFFGVASHLRELARTENYFIRSALAQNRQAEAVERATALAKFANQVSRDGTLIQYLVGRAVRAIALEPLRKDIERLHNRAALEQLLRWAREDERHRPPLTGILETEHHYNRAMLKQMLRNPQPINPVDVQWWERLPLVPQIFIKTSIPEMERAWKQIKAYAAKPAWERKASDFPTVRHPINAMLMPVLENPIHMETVSIATTRLLGCVAAIRLHRQRTGRYPNSLEALQLGELIIDPFTGKPFLYKVDPRKGFMIYSVGMNGVDDGGVVAARDWNAEQGDLAPQPAGLTERRDLWLK